MLTLEMEKYWKYNWESGTIWNAYCSIFMAFRHESQIQTSAFSWDCINLFYCWYMRFLFIHLHSCDDTKNRAKTKSYCWKAWARGHWKSPLVKRSKSIKMYNTLIFSAWIWRNEERDITIKQTTLEDNSFVLANIYSPSECLKKKADFCKSFMI